MPTAKAYAAPDARAEAGEKDVWEKDAEAFRTIGEAAAELGLKTHVLRFWETKFDALKPMKRPDGRRYYRPEDMEVLRTLQKLLHVQGLTIRGATKMLKSGEADARDDDITAPEEGPEATIVEAGHSVRDLQEVVRDAVERGEFQAPAVAENNAARQRLESLLHDLTDLKSRLDVVRLAG